MEKTPVFALMYDFDRTLSPKDMQEYGFIPGIKMEPSDFWKKCDLIMRENSMDQILAYMLVMCQQAKGKMLFTRDTLRALGRNVVLFDGVKSWFKRINAYAEKRGMAAEHYIISSGLKEIIEGTPIAGEFKRIYAAEFCYDLNGEPYWPAMAVNYTSKTQFLFRINKGIMEVTENNPLNEFMPEAERRVPFRNMVYIGDGLTDVPCMKLVRSNGGHSIAVYSGDRGPAAGLVLEGRADFALRADYSKGAELEATVFAIIDQGAAKHRTVTLHNESLARAQKEKDERERSAALSLCDE